MKRRISAGILALVSLLALTACNKAASGWMDIKRAFGGVEGTFTNYGVDGQSIFEAHCRSMDMWRDTGFDRHNGNGDKIEDGSVITVSCGTGQFSTVGFTSVYYTDNARSHLVVGTEQFYDLRIQNDDRGVPIVNRAWREFRNLFQGVPRLLVLYDQWNNPISAYAGNDVVTYSTDIDKSTMFQVDDAWVMIIRGSYEVLDTALIG